MIYRKKEQEKQKPFKGTNNCRKLASGFSLTVSSPPGRYRCNKYSVFTLNTQCETQNNKKTKHVSHSPDLRSSPSRLLRPYLDPLILKLLNYGQYLCTLFSIASDSLSSLILTHNNYLILVKYLRLTLSSHLLHLYLCSLSVHLHSISNKSVAKQLYEIFLILFHLKNKGITSCHFNNSPQKGKKKKANSYGAYAVSSTKVNVRYKSGLYFHETTH